MKLNQVLRQFSALLSPRSAWFSGQSLPRFLLCLIVALSLVSCATTTGNSGNSGNKGTSSIGSETVDPDGHSHQTGYKLEINDAKNLTQLQPVSGRNIPMVRNLGLLATPTASVELELLVIAATEDEIGLEAAEALLKQVGVPYNVLIASTQTLTNDMLMNGDVGRYQGVILTTGSLTYDTGGGVFASALEAEEWQLLWAYESNLGVRQVALFNFPATFPEDYGIKGIDPDGDGVANGNADATNMTLTTEGQQIFTSLKTNAAIPVLNSFKYPSVLDSSNGVTATPILRDSAGNILGVTSTSADGRERMALTMAHNKNLLHTQALGYDILNWVTQGVFIGERRHYLSLDVDDWFLKSLVWNPDTLSNFDFDDKFFRISAKDVYASKAGVLDLRSRFNAPFFNYNQVYNARDADLNAAADCSASATLTGATLCDASFYNWVNHTFTHAEMDFLSYNSSRTELDENIQYGLAEPLDFDKAFLVTGKHSGLGWSRINQRTDGQTCEVDQVPTDEFCQFGLDASNKELIKASIDLGVTYLAANRGWNTHERTDGCDSCFLIHPLEKRIKLVPRWPTNVFFNVTTPTENTSEFNYLYGPNGIVRDGNGNAFFQTNQSWQQVLDFEASIALRHILSFSPYPHFVHQANLFEYTAGRSLLYDWSEAVLAEHDKYFAVPIISQDWFELTSTLDGRTKFFEALKADAIRGVWDRVNNTIAIESDVNTTLYLTGLTVPATDSWVYGNQLVTQMQINAGQTVTAQKAQPSNNSAPSLAGLSSQNNIATETVSFSASATDANNDLLSFSATGLPDGIAIHPQTGKISGILPLGSQGSYNVVVTVTDGVANSQQSFNWTVAPAQIIANFTENFNSDNGGFSYRDGMFKFTDLYGNFYARPFRHGGFLKVRLGGRDNVDILEMSGGWERTLELSQPAVVTIDLKYRLELKGGYEDDEFSELFVAVNGRNVGLNGKDYIVKAVGRGNNNPNLDTGWRNLSLNLGKLPAGSHRIQFGGFNNKKTWIDEETILSFDDVSVKAYKNLTNAALTTAPPLTFTGTWEGFFQKSGTTKQITLAQTPTNNCYPKLRVEAESYQRDSGIQRGPSNSNPISVAYNIDNGDWLKFNNVEFCNGFDRVTVRYSSNSSRKGFIEIREDSPTGRLRATLDIKSTGSWSNYEEDTVLLSDADGTEDIYMVFKSESGNSGDLLSLDWIEYTNPNPSTITAKDSNGNVVWNAGSTPESANTYVGEGFANFVTDRESGLVEGNLKVINNNVIQYTWLKSEEVIQQEEDAAPINSPNQVINPNDVDAAGSNSRKSYETVVFYRKQYNTSTTLTPPTPTTDTYPIDPTVIPTDPPNPDPPNPDPPNPDPPAGNNILVNPDFESGLASWNLSGCGAGTTTSVTDASNGAKALKLSGDTICTGQGVASSGAGDYTLTCDVKNIAGKYADISLYADSTNVDYKAIAGNTFSSISLSGSFTFNRYNTT